jgi:hypothetical protein
MKSLILQLVQTFPAFYGSRLHNGPPPALYLSQKNTVHTLPNDLFWKWEDNININLRDIDLEEGRWMELASCSLVYFDLNGVKFPASATIILLHLSLFNSVPGRS